MKNSERSVFPVSEETTYRYSGLTKQEQAAIALRVPRSGDPDIDAMIREAVRRDLAAQAMQGLLGVYCASKTKSPGRTHVEYMVGLSVHAADALIAELKKPQQP